MTKNNTFYDLARALEMSNCHEVTVTVKRSIDIENNIDNCIHFVV